MFTSSTRDQTKLLTSTLVPILSLLTPLLSFKENVRLDSTLKIFRAVYKQPTCWRSLYQLHFGEIYFDKDLKEQCIAAYLHQQIEEEMYHGKMDTLFNHIMQHKDKKWARFYLAYFVQKNKLQNNFVDAVKAALDVGDPRASYLLFKEYQKALTFGLVVTDASIISILKKLTENTKHCAGKKYICLFYCLLARNHPSEIGYSVKLFFKTADANDKNIGQFVDFLVDTFYTLQKITMEENKWIRKSERLKSLPTALEVVMECFNRSKLKIDADILFDWVKKSADAGNAAAAFHCAELAHQVIQDASLPTFAEKYYLQAIKGGDKRAEKSLFHLKQRGSGLTNCISLMPSCQA